MHATYRTGLGRIAIGAGACLAVATAWYVLFQAHIVAPEFTQLGDNQAYFAWWRPIEWQTTGIYLLASVGFVGVAVLGFLLRGASGAGLVVGGVVAAVAQLAELGGQHAVLQASLTKVDPGILGTVGFITDSISHALFIGGYASLGVGVLGLALRDDPVATDAFGRLAGVVLGVALVALGVLGLADPFELLDPLTGVVGIVLAPVWLWRVALGVSSRAAAADAMAPPSVQPGRSLS